jgi:cytochrome c biogenesis protein CcdA
VLLAAVAAAVADLPGGEPWRGEVLRRGTALQAALRDGDEVCAVAAATALAGLGEGSTPAGDDYLVGVLHALRWSCAGSPDLIATLAAACEGRTTARSAEWLAAAARGEASPVWRAMLAALADGDEAAVGTAARAVRSTGHTSGAFSLRGFLDTVGE